MYNPILYAFGFALVSLQAKVFLISSCMTDIYHPESGKRLSGLPCLRRDAVVRWRWTSHWHLPTASRLWATAEHREPATASRFGNGSLMPPRRLIAVPPCSLSPLPDKDFYDRPPTCRLFQQSTGRNSDNPPSCLVGLSQTRPFGTGQCHFIIDWDYLHQINPNVH